MKVPDWVRQFFLIVTGESWPQADEDQLRALARLYAALEEILAAVEEELVAIADAVEGGGWKGEAAQAARARLKALVDSGALRKLVDAAGKVSRYAFDAGANVEYAKASILGQ
ncbi:WXG100-like domain-containing protein, partial [Catellatospora coxensis]